MLSECRGEKSWIEEKPAGASTIIDGIAAHPLKHIVAALVREKSDTAIVSRALSLAKTEKAMLTLLHVVDSALPQVYTDDVYDEHTRNDEQYLLEIAKQIRSSGVPVEIALAYGNPPKELIDFAAS